MSNSSLVCYTAISPNKTSPRNHIIDTITIHCMAGNLSVETCGNVFAPASRQASSNYGIGSDGRIALYVEEKDRSWCSSSSSNDHRAITIEVANDGGAPDWHVSDLAIDSLVRLCADICQRNNIKQLLWRGDQGLIGRIDLQNMTVHRWFARKACPGDYLYNLHGFIASQTNKLIAKDTGNYDGVQGVELNGLSDDAVISKVGPLFTEDEKSSGVLACISLAQFILESGYGHSELATAANNFFGMKKSLSGNTWPNSKWDGTSVYTKDTQEQNADGTFQTVTAEFRKYPCLERSIADHSAYLLGAKKGNDYRYPSIATIKDYKVVAQIIKDGGYATSIDYVDKLCSIIEKWNLTQYNATADTPVAPQDVKYYRVRTTWGDANSQKGAFTSLTNAKTCADANPGYKVYDWDGNQVYPEPVSGSTFPQCPFSVEVIVPDLNYRAEPCMGKNVRGVTGIGTFTIVEVKDGWGHLKSGAGWIWLGNANYCKIKDSIQNDTPVTPKPVVPEKKSNEEIAAEVWKGLWGNNPERKQRLIQAGYDYDAVQAIVEDIASGKKKPTTVQSAPAKKTVTEIAKEIYVEGKWGVGAERKRRLTQAGYDYDAVQAAIKKLYY